ncbi:MAG: hypothetical protein VYA08_12420, partial [Pseudomonadota bacterium]|nr:hypothetical protein [Pseudomonadota bacterium]
MPAEIKSSANRAKRAQILADKTRQHTDQGIIAPCVEIIRDRIKEGESIGFDGRNKFISESLKIGFDQDWIVDSFLQFPDPYRYGVLEPEVETESGYRISDQYSPELLSELDVSCLKCAQFCQVDSCYRSSEFLPAGESPSFDQFRQEGRDKLAQAIDQNIEQLGITAIDGSIASGKTYQIVKKSLQLLAEANLAVFLPTHKAIDDVFNDKIPVLQPQGIEIAPNAIGVHVYGKNLTHGTCLEDHHGKSCSSCPVFSRWFYQPKEENNQTEKDKQALAGQMRNRLRNDNMGQAVNLEQLQAMARNNHPLCASVASKILARVEENESHTVMAIIPHSYLTNRFQQSFIDGINPSYCFIDEADMLPDSLISENQQYLTLAQTRSRLDHPYDKACNFKCSACHLHFSDTFTGGIQPSRSLSSEADYHDVGEP